MAPGPAESLDGYILRLGPFGASSSRPRVGAWASGVLKTRSPDAPTWRIPQQGGPGLSGAEEASAHC